MRSFDRNALRRMALVGWLIDRHRATQPLRGWRVLFIQHQLENHLAQARAVLELGVDARDLHWIDIPYTSSPEIREVLVSLGVPAGNFKNHRYNLTQRYAAYQRTRVSRWIKSYMDRYGNAAPLLVLDDGGYFLEALICFREHFKRLAVVEQTTRGINKLSENIAIQYYCRDVPLVDVATSDPKKNVEPPFIARAVREAAGERLKKILGRAHVELDRGKVLVLGYGAIGKEVAREVRERFGLRPEQVFVFDTDQQKRDAANGVGYSLWDAKDYSNVFQLVIGCTGTRAFNIWNYVHLAKRSVLISASSGSAEVAREDFVELAESCNVDDIQVRNPETLRRRSVHSDITLQIVDHVVTIANGGFPINFDGRLDRIPAEDIQITVALMVAGAIQAVTTPTKGLVPLDPSTCNTLVDHFQKLRGGQPNEAFVANAGNSALHH